MAAELLPVGDFTRENICNVLKTRGANRIVRMDDQRGPGPGDFERLQSLEGKSWIWRSIRKLTGVFWRSDRAATRLKGDS
jgi:hypothetical protein